MVREADRTSGPRRHVLIAHLAGTAASTRSLAGWEVRVHDSEAGSAQQPDGGGEANAGEEAGASWATQVSDWSTFPKPPDSKRG